MTAHQDGPSGTPPIPIPVRRDSNASCGSDAYAPLPPGRWLLDFHGNCSRCHHHHNSVRVKVDVSGDPEIVSHVRCRGCQEKWLAIGGRNKTQISLLSVNSTKLDPIETDVRYTLISMVRSTTAIASMSPVLGGIPEGSLFWDSSHPHLRPSSPGVGASLAQAQTTATPRSNNDVLRLSKTRLASRQQQQHHHFSHFRQRLEAHLHTLHHTRIKVSISKPARPSDKSLGKRPVRLSHPLSLSDDCAQIAPTVSVSEVTTIGDMGKLEAGIWKKRVAREQPYLEALSSEKDRIAWFRSRYTAFKNRQAKREVPSITSAIATQPSQENAPPDRRRCSTEFMGLGSHFGHFDRFWQNSAVPRSSTLSISDHATDAEIAVDDKTPFTSSRSATGELSRNNPGIPRPQSLHAPPRIVQQLRQARPERFSTGSTMVGDFLPAGLTRTQSSATSDRISQASTIRASFFGNNSFSMSQTSMTSH